MQRVRGLRVVVWMLAVCAGWAFDSGARAQDGAGSGTGGGAGAGPGERPGAETREAPAATVDPSQSPPVPIDGVTWERGPGNGKLGSEAQVALPDGWWFTGSAGTQTLMKAMENLVNGRELGFVAPPPATGRWYCVFEFDPIGYVKDDERDELDADEMLDSMRESSARVNEERRKRGWGTLDVVGWEVPPRYDPATNHLEWALRYEDERGQPVVNMNVRLLGRGGAMSVTWVGDPSELAGALPQFRAVLAGHRFVAGHRYSEYQKGDKIAEYGLTGLVAGGAIAAAAKTGLLKKFWKLILFVCIGIAGLARKLFGGGSKAAESPTARRVRPDA